MEEEDDDKEEVVEEKKDLDGRIGGGKCLERVEILERLLVENNILWWSLATPTLTLPPTLPPNDWKECERERMDASSITRNDAMGVGLVRICDNDVNNDDNDDNVIMEGIGWDGVGNVKGCSSILF